MALTGDPLETWTSPPPKSEVWPKWLAEDRDGTAVYSLGYDAPLSDSDCATMHPVDIASNALSRLLVEPQLKAGQVILVGHSLGGLVIKMMLRKADVEKTMRDEAALIACEWSHSWPRHIAGLIWRVWLTCCAMGRPSAATISLVRNDPYLRELNEGYRGIAKEREIAHLILTETRPSVLNGKFLGVIKYPINLGLIVKPDSGDPGVSSNPIPIPADHCDCEACEPEERNL